MDIRSFNSICNSYFLKKSQNIFIRILTPQSSVLDTLMFVTLFYILFYVFEILYSTSFLKKNLKGRENNPDSYQALNLSSIWALGLGQPIYQLEPRGV